MTTLSTRNIKRRFVEIFDIFWFKIPNASLIRNLSLKLMKAERFGNNDSIIRNLLTRTLPWNPLVFEDGPTLDIYCLVAEKDLELLRFTLPSLNIISSNPIRYVHIVTPGAIEIEVKKICNSIGFQATIITDEFLFENFDLDIAQFKHGHPKMLVLKYLCALHSDFNEVLVVDGDTIFLKPRQWVTKKQKLTVVSQELHKFHIDYCREYFEIDSRLNLGFTTQSQILSKQDIEAITAQIGGLKKLVTNFNDTYREYRDGSNKSYFPAEWQLACEWSYKFNPLKTSFGSYSNLGLDRKFFFSLMLQNRFVELNSECCAFLRQRVPFLGSVSLHDYK